MAINSAAATSAPRQPPSRRRRLSPWLFQVVNFCFWIALYFYVPILPVYAERNGASLTVIGVMLSAYGIMQFLLRIPVGVGSDLLGRRRPFVIAGLGAAGLGALWFVWMPAPPGLIFARALTGIGACAWVVITVMYAGYFAPAQVTRAVAFLAVTNGLGQAVATFIGGAAAQSWGWHAPFYLSAGAAIVGIVVVGLCVEARTGPAVAPVTWRRLVVVGTHPQLLLVAGLAAVNTYVQFTTIYGFTPVFAAHELGANRADLGVLTAVSVLSLMAAQFLAPTIVNRFGFRGPTIASFLLNAAMTAVIPLVPALALGIGLRQTAALPLLILTQSIAGLARGLLQTSLMSQSILAVPSAERATAMGVFQAVYASGMLLGPLVGGRLADAVGLNALFWLAGLMSTVGAVVVLRATPPETTARRSTTPA